MMMSRCDAEEDPSQTKKRKQSPSSGLPEEMVLSCLASLPWWPMVAGSTSWHSPSMGVPRYSAAPGVVDGKIYILGGCDDRNSSRWGEVFDPKKQTWDALPIPPPNCSRPSMWESIVIKEDKEEKLVAINGAGACVSYIPSESKWKKGNKKTSQAHEWERPVTTHVMEWREVMGLESLRETLAASKLVNYGGRLGDLWESNKPLMQAAGFEITELDENFPGHKLSNSGPNMLIFWDACSSHKDTCQIRGNILWSEPVMTLDPPPPHQLHCHILYTSPLNL
ncbi:hypothetical protein Bca52824_073105 [Brassica carinata]|uniref:FKB95-like N-terminal Kelch domain-containing protein n=1 Tax=Brassica carinata TaxID=52824 RepID=A0A8X7U6D3_BRACI|nr:hypothetical protein Bca52824_073105 [Brassica carinata]